MDNKKQTLIMLQPSEAIMQHYICSWIAEKLTRRLNITLAQMLLVCVTAKKKHENEPKIYKENIIFTARSFWIPSVSDNINRAARYETPIQ